MFFDLLPGKGYVCAHRGARALAPENTMLAARKALEIGADFWEMDVRLTADNELVVFHDDFLGRTTDVAKHERFKDRAPWPAHAFTLAELRTLDAGSWFAEADPHGTIASGEVSPTDLEGMKGLRVPTLREALEFSRANNFPINIEIKDQLHAPGDMRIAADVREELLQTDACELTLISSFNHDYLRFINTLEADIPLAALVEDEHPADLLNYLKALDVQGYNPDYEITSLEMVRELVAHGFQVTPFTVNDMDKALALLDAGCFAITTDRPHELRERLRER